MITALDPTKFEVGLKAYLDARLAALEVTVPTITGESAATLAAPAVYVGLSRELVGISTVTVALRCQIPDTEVDGWYQVEPMLVVVTPTQISGIEISHHQAVYAALTQCFPARPRADASTEDQEAWAALHTALSSVLETASGYRAGGWFARSSIYARRDDRIEQPFVVRIGAVHSEA
jgi:hypothetical protein